MVSRVDGLFGAGGAGTPAILVVVLDEKVIGDRDEGVPVLELEPLHEASIVPPTTTPTANSLIRRIVSLSVSLARNQAFAIQYSRLTQYRYAVQLQRKHPFIG